jgi:hypothetical protein
MHRAQHHGFKRIENANSCLAGDVILLSNQIDERDFVRVSLITRMDVSLPRFFFAIIFSSG